MPSPSPDPIPPISDAEWTVMRALWQIQEGSLAQVIEALEGQTDWRPRTIQTLVRRLVEKGAVERIVSGRDHLYRPAIDEAACQHAASRSFLNRVFGGKLTPFLATFVEREPTTPEEIAALRKLLEDHDESP